MRQIRVLNISYGFVEVPDGTSISNLNNVVQEQLDLGNFYVDQDVKYCEETQKEEIIGVLEDLLKEFKGGK